jgi:hypothetical protein
MGFNSAQPQHIKCPFRSFLLCLPALPLGTGFTSFKISSSPSPSISNSNFSKFMLPVTVAAAAASATAATSACGSGPAAAPGAMGSGAGAASASASGAGAAAAAAASAGAAAGAAGAFVDSRTRKAPPVAPSPDDGTAADCNDAAGDAGAAGAADAADAMPFMYMFHICSLYVPYSVMYSSITYMYICSIRNTASDWQQAGSGRPRPGAAQAAKQG